MDACHTGIVVVQVRENCLFGRQNTRLPQFCRPELQPGQVLPQEAFPYDAPLAGVPVVAERAQAALENMGAIPASVSADHSLVDAALTRMEGVRACVRACVCVWVGGWVGGCLIAWCIAQDLSYAGQLAIKAVPALISSKK